MKINWIEIGQTTTGKTKADITFEGDTKKVTAWADFPGFADLKPGSEVEGTIVPKAVGNKTYYTLYAPKGNFARAGVSKPNFAIKEAQATKREDIATAQKNKEEGIRVSSTFRDATLITVEMFRIGYAPDESPRDEQFRKEWTKWRDWLWKNWDGDFAPF